MTTKTYLVLDSINGFTFGEYQAHNEMEAIHLAVKDAGYENILVMGEVLGGFTFMEAIETTNQEP